MRLAANALLAVALVIVFAGYRRRHDLLASRRLFGGARWPRVTLAYLQWYAYTLVCLHSMAAVLIALLQ